MRNIGIVIVIAIALAFIVWYNKQKRLAGNSTIDFKGVSFKPGVLNSTLTFDVSVKNPTNVDVNLTGFDFDAFINGIKLGQVTYSNPVVIAAGKESRLKIPFTMGNVTTLQNIPGLFNSLVNGVKVKVTGSLHSALGSFPIDQETILTV